MRQRQPNRTYYTFASHTSHVRFKHSYDGCHRSTPIPLCGGSATGKEVDPAPSDEGHVHLRGREISNRDHAGLESRRLPTISLGVVGHTYDVQKHIGAADQEEVSVLIRVQASTAVPRYTVHGVVALVYLRDVP